MKILIATDGSDYSRAAIETACEIAVKSENTKIKIVSVYQPYIALDIYPQAIQYSENTEHAMRGQAETCAGKAIETIRKCLPEAKIELTTKIISGAPAPVIIETAEEWNADLIVVGSHGRGFWGRALLGSVSDAVNHHAPCSVLVVRKKNRMDDGADA